MGTCGDKIIQISKVSSGRFYFNFANENEL